MNKASLSKPGIHAGNIIQSIAPALCRVDYTRRFMALANRTNAVYEEADKLNDGAEAKSYYYLFRLLSRRQWEQTMFLLYFR